MPHSSVNWLLSVHRLYGCVINGLVGGSLGWTMALKIGPHLEPEVFLYMLVEEPERGAYPDFPGLT